jgi:hypothetical protein
MAISTGNRAAPRAVRIARLVGYFVFLAAFFLPACRQVTTPGAGAPEVYKGWFCAWITIVNSLNHEFWQSKDFLAILSGWINPLMLVYVASLFSRKLRVLRRIIAVVVAIFILGTWVYFYLAPLVPLLGHILWVLGIVQILFGEALNERSLPLAAE